MSDVQYTYQQVEKWSDEKLLEAGLKRDKRGKIRNKSGHYIPGQTGRTDVAIEDSTGMIITDADRAIFGTNAKKALELGLSKVKTWPEMFKVAPKLIDYQDPKLQSVDQRVLTFNTSDLLVAWSDDSGKLLNTDTFIEGQMLDAEPASPEDGVPSPDHINS